MITNPLISIVIPVYNASETIRKVLTSIFDQTYGNYEIIIINDGSTDDSERIITEILSENSQVNARYYYQKNKGVSAARNEGLKNSTGDLLMFLDSDDQWVKDKIEKQIKILNDNHQIDFLGSNRDGAILKSFLWYKFKRINKISPRMLLYKNFFMTSSVVFRKEVVKECGFFNEDMSYSEDLEYFVRIIEKFNCYLLNESLISAVTNKPTFGHSGLSARLWKMEKGELNAITKGYKLEFVGFVEYCFICTFSMLKYLRRLTLTTLRG